MGFLKSTPEERAEKERQKEERERLQREREFWPRQLEKHGPPAPPARRFSKSTYP